MFKPATPQQVSDALIVYVRSGSSNGNEAMRGICLKAANAYPKLIEDRARLVEALRESFSALDACLNSGDTASALNEADRVLTEYRPILRELGEL